MSRPLGADPSAMTWPRPTARAMLVLHLAAGLPLLALAAWFGAIDRVPSGEGRCASCGVEPYVIAAHLAAALWLGAVVAATSAARRETREGAGVAGPGRRTVVGLAAAGAFAAVALVWHPLFSLPALAAMVVSVFLGPAAALWWVLRAVAWLRRPARPEQLTASLVAAWIGLAVLLPALFGWTWAARVEWLVF
jgi:hypothetical protein